jgi:hypothetical protein
MLMHFDNNCFSLISGVSFLFGLSCFRAFVSARPLSVALCFSARWADGQRRLYVAAVHRGLIGGLRRRGRVLEAASIPGHIYGKCVCSLRSMKAAAASRAQLPIAFHEDEECSAEPPDPHYSACMDAALT